MGLMIVCCGKCGRRMMVSDREEDKREHYVCLRKGCKE